MLYEEIRKIELQKFQRNQAFMEDWNKKGIEKHSKNMEVRRWASTNDLNFKNKMNEKKVNFNEKLQSLTKKEAHEEIDVFEKKIKKIRYGESIPQKLESINNQDII